MYKKYANILVKRGGVIHDSEIAGFQIVKTGQGVISFRYYHRVAGKRKNITIGHFPAITTVQARLLAKEKALDVAKGNYLAKIKNHFPNLLKKPLSDIGKE